MWNDANVINVSNVWLNAMAEEGKLWYNTANRRSA